MEQLSIEVFQPSSGIHSEFFVPSSMRIDKATKLMTKALAEAYGLVILDDHNVILFDPQEGKPIPEDATFGGAGVHNGSELFLL